MVLFFNICFILYSNLFSLLYSFPFLFCTALGCLQQHCSECTRIHVKMLVGFRFTLYLSSKRKVYQLHFVIGKRACCRLSCDPDCQRCCYCHQRQAQLCHTQLFQIVHPPALRSKICCCFTAFIFLVLIARLPFPPQNLAWLILLQLMKCKFN